MKIKAFSRHVYGDRVEEIDKLIFTICTLQSELINKYIPDSGMSSTEEGYDYGDKKQELREMVRAMQLPQFPLDELIHRLGGM